jgi:hypothetical protein
MRFFRLFACQVVLVATALVTGVSQAQEIDFGRDIQPILARRCYKCHGPDKDEGGLRLNRQDAVLAKLESGEHAVVPGKPEASALLLRIAADDADVRMPPEEKPLAKAEIELIRRWIAAGAVWQKPWAYQPPARPAVPTVKDAAWVRNPIDAFVLQQLERRGLQPAPPAEKVQLLRRAYYDLTGLPPSPADVEAFVADQSTDAYEKVIDRLLDSERYGERWARHWLDLVRYADTNSFERDGVKPNAWRFRDYVIRSFNDDKPYDRFIIEQLAGDELPDANAETIIATGYYRLGLWDDEPADRLQARYDELDDILSTTAQVMLGLTINCARCHDHKIDPIPQTDYYRMLAFFHGVPSYGDRGDQRSNNQTDIATPELTARYQQLDDQKRVLCDQMTAIEQQGIVKMSAEDQRKSEGRERDKLLAQRLQMYLDEAQQQQYSELKSQLAKLDAIKLPQRESALSVNKCMRVPPETLVFQRGNPHVPGKKVEPGFPAVLGAPDPVIPAPPPDAKSCGRRTVLAKWIASAENPLTARVMANRIWQNHFGRGIVRSPNNFGGLGIPPTHPELLDWLAAELTDGGWRLKSLHKLIMTSNTYRMSSQANPDGLAKDPENNLFWRFDMRRLSAEEIRDSIHAVNGRLNVTMYGPGFYPEISQEVLAGQSRPGDGWGKSSPEEQARRSIYIHVKRSLITPILSSFDFPETDSSCDARFVTTQPAQALGMMNGDFAIQQATEFANRLRREAASDRQSQVKLALKLALCREPDAASVQRGLDLIDTMQRKHGLNADAALNYYCLVVLNLNEFLYLD